MTKHWHWWDKKTTYINKFENNSKWKFESKRIQPLMINFWNAQYINHLIRAREEKYKSMIILIGHGFKRVKRWDWTNKKKSKWVNIIVS